MRRLLAACVAAALHHAPALASPLLIVAAENVYGDVASQIGGPDAAVTSILSRPGQDPHLFEASPSVARALAGASITVSNGDGYDPWMSALVGASARPGRQSLVVASLMHRRPGDNPHLWYDPATMPVFARALAAAMTQADPAHAAAYARRCQAFLQSLAPVEAKIAGVRSRFAGVPIAATEPVFAPMANALGLAMQDTRFALAVMNDAEPASSDVARFEDDLRARRIRALITNVQVSDASVTRLVALARQSGVPVVGVTETLPAGMTYQAWMLGELQAVEKALASS
jgi:zinc/manganese transport system substrate-binding protein